jgi:anti-anti-sigma regulatory factor
MTRAILSARPVFETESLVLTLDSGTFGSLELDRLDQLETELREWRLTTAARFVVIDLSRVTSCGSGLLGCLARLRTQLELMGKKLVVCGDNTGLIEVVGWAVQMNLQADVQQALRHAVRSLVSI